MSAVKIPISETVLREALANIKGFERIQDLLKEITYGKRYSYLPQDTLIAEVIKNINEPYKVTTFDTSVANVNPIAFGFKGAVFQVIDVRDANGTLDANSYIDVRFNSPQANPIRFRLGYRLVTPFNCYWISNPAQAGVIFTIGMGLEFDNIYQFDFPISPQAQQLTSLLANTRGLNGDTGAQVKVSSYNPSTVGATIVYTVTANKTLYLASAELNVYGGGLDRNYLYVRNVADVTQYELLCEFGGTGSPPNSGLTNGYLPALKIPAGYDIVTYSTSGNAIHACITGWEE